MCQPQRSAGRLGPLRLQESLLYQKFCVCRQPAKQKCNPLRPKDPTVYKRQVPTTLEGYLLKASIFHQTEFPTFLRLPWWFRGKESICQCRRCGFDPWLRKIPWRRKGQPTPVFSPGKPHGQRSLVGYSPQGNRVRLRD